MSTGSSIEWTEATWNPTTGCSKVSEGCRNCYAEKLSARFSTKPGKYLGVTTKGKFNGTLRFHEDVLDIPLRRRKPTMYFVNSMSDLFHEKVPFQFIDKVYAVMALCPQHTFQVLTKRPERMAEYFGPGRVRIVHEVASSLLRSGQCLESSDWPLPNVWLGTSVEDQTSADTRIPHLLRCPASVRFLSVEPLLEEIDLGEFLYRDVELLPSSEGGMDRPIVHRPKSLMQWVIVGGESGPGARPCNVEWIRSIVRQCKAAGVPAFCKQLGAQIAIANDSLSEWPNDGDGVLTDADYQPHYQGEEMVVRLNHPKGGDPSEWPDDLRVREWPK